MIQPTCTCKIVHPKGHATKSGARIAQCPLCAAAPEMYATLEHIKTIHLLDSCPRVEAALAAARSETK